MANESCPAVAIGRRSAGDQLDDNSPFIQVIVMIDRGLPFASFRDARSDVCPGLRAYEANLTIVPGGGLCPFDRRVARHGLPSAHSGPIRCRAVKDARGRRHATPAFPAPFGNVGDETAFRQAGTTFFLHVDEKWRNVT